MKKFLFILILLFSILCSAFAFSDNSYVLIGERLPQSDGTYKVPVLVSDDLKTFCIGLTGSTFKLTAKSGTNWKFRDGSAVNLSQTGTAEVGIEYTKITLVASTKAAAEEAFQSIRYIVPAGTTPVMEIDGLDFEVPDSDVFLDKHIYRIDSANKGFLDAVNWCFQQEAGDSAHTKGYPVTITNDNENQVAFVFFKKLNGGQLSGSRNGGYQVFWLGAVPSSNASTITVAKNTSGCYQMSISGSAVASHSTSQPRTILNGYKWMTGTPEAGTTIPTSYWCNGQPDAGSPIVYGHKNEGINGAGQAWDDLGSDFYHNTEVSACHACVEFEPETKHFSKDLSHMHTWEVSVDGTVLTATCNSGTCSTNPFNASLELKDTIHVYSGTPFTKNDIFGTTDFSTFYITTGIDLSASDVLVYKVNDTVAKNDITSICNGRFFGELTLTGKTTSATAKLLFSTEHDHDWVYTANGTDGLAVYCTRSDGGYICDYFGPENAVKLSMIQNNLRTLVPSFDPKMGIF